MKKDRNNKDLRSSLKCYIKHIFLVIWPQDPFNINTNNNISVNKVI